jgi:hypothetical protein
MTSIRDPIVAGPLAIICQLKYEAKNVQLRLPLEERKPKAKPVSLFPLSFDDAITALSYASILLA